MTTLPQRMAIMSSLLLRIAPLLLLLLLLLATVNSASAAVDTHHGEALIQWLRLKGGFFSSKIQLRRLDINKYGMFAVEPIAAEEELLVIPRECVLSGKNICSTARKLIKELKLGDESEYAPYVHMLLDEPEGQLPSAWSKEGKQLLMLVTAEDLPPTDIIYSWKEDCGGKNKDTFGKHAYHLLMQRGWDNLMIPVYDFIRHRNGNWTNTETSFLTSKKKPIIVEASRDIQVGEEIYTSVNLCNDCGSRKEHYGTGEILRDYGVVEDFPQRFIFPYHEIAFDIDQVDNDSKEKFQITWLWGEPSNEAMRYLDGHRDRLVNMQKEVDNLPVTSTDVPEKEWHLISDYHEALLRAINRAMEDAQEFIDPQSCDEEHQTCAALQEPKLKKRYDMLNTEEDHLDYAWYTCDFGRTMEFYGYQDLEDERSPYQAIHFFMDPENLDTCFELDKIVQICSSYRPHYHEMMVHYAARFLNNVQRVLFVGGGDSMLLHEALQYPSLELVVGLELDQKVTRWSFKHFGTQPHWDNEKVEWWFGDAAKSLLMLPKDYYGSFDMVLVDLSETVMSLSVTDELDIMGALALLLKPDGILVKNELYLEQASDVFDYVFQAHYYDIPVICSQTLVFGSNHVDFLTHPLKDHHIKDLQYLKPLEEIEYNYDIWHDYRRGDYRGQQHCKEKDEPEKEPTEQKNSPGILMIVEAEDATGKLEQPKKLKDTLVKAIKKAGLKVISTVVPEDKGDVVVVILQEGYVMARAWPEHKYCAFDVHFWSSFDKQDSARKALVNAIGSDSSGRSSSAYRIVTGGMFGVSTWKEDEMKSGPRVTQLCSRTPGPDRDSTMAISVVEKVLEETMSMVQDTNVVMAVVCGYETEPCESLDVMEKYDKVKKVITLSLCPTVLQGDSRSKEGKERMYACEQTLLTKLKNSVPEDEKINSIIVDLSAPFEMAQIVHRIFDSRRNTLRFLAPGNMTVMAPALNEEEIWRRNFLERFRRDVITFEPVFRGEVLFNSSDSSMEMGIAMSGDPLFFKHFLEVTGSIENETGMVSEIRNVQGGLFNNMPDFVPSQFFAPDDYDQSSPLEQWMSQQPLGYQAVFQLELGSPFEDLEFGDRVKGNYKMQGTWFGATVVYLHEDDTYDLYYDDGDYEAEVERMRIQKLRGFMANVSVGDRVETRFGKEWFPGNVTKVHEDFTYDIVHDDGEEAEDVPRHKFRKRQTPEEKEALEKKEREEMTLTAAQLVDALKHALSTTNAENMTSAEVHDFTNVGDGCVLVSLWSGGSAIVLWDGRFHIDINLFMYAEDAKIADSFANNFQSQIPRLKPTLRDEQPRGYGRVVNFVKDVEPRQVPPWAEEDDEEEED